MTDNFISILREELIPAMGCTEPIALAYAAAYARKVLGSSPEGIVARCSGNIIKNVRCVTIPNSGGMTGIESAVTLGALGGNAEWKMEVLESVDGGHVEAAKRFLAEKRCRVEYLESDNPLHFTVELTANGESVEVEVCHSHTNIVAVKKNGEEVYSADGAEAVVYADRSVLSIENIKAFADGVDPELIEPLIEKQIRCNMDIAAEGMTGKYGLGIGRVILSSYPDDVVTHMRAYAAATSEARMDGCDLPVIINSGSGNQGIASSVPVIVYAKERGIPKERLYRALVFSGLLTVCQKEFIGKLSAFCGAVSASCAAGAAVSYMEGGTIEQIKDTIDNTLANIPGILCDGAKISCAAKIASCVDAAMLAHFLSVSGKTYKAYTGLLKEEAGETISCVGYIGKVGMRQTDREIVKMMLEGEKI